MGRTRIVILGAAGRDFHNFNVVFREDVTVEVVAFTAAQIPGIEDRRYPPDLAGPLYPEGIPILPESRLAELIRERRIDQAVFSYSDVSHEDVMHKASIVVAAGADFRLLSARSTMIKSKKPVISLCAVRTGSGKSPAARRIAALIRSRGRRVGVIRHPMPYGDLSRQAVQRFVTARDLAEANCTIEEREEYEPHLAAGGIVYAGVDYEKILRLAEAEADVILWDGGNNDTSFYAPDLEIVVLDPHRAGHERSYYPGEVNFLRAGVFLLNKVDSADPALVDAVLRNARAFNPRAKIIRCAMPVTVDQPERIRGKRVLVIEDGPTLTHGGMAFGAGVLAARKHGAAEIVDPRPQAVGSIADAFARYPHLDKVLPALGYGAAQIRELEETIRRVACDLVLIATPVDLRRLLTIDRPACRVSYELEEIGKPDLGDVIGDFLRGLENRG
ncbi:MAG: GTPase [Planctomycetes bacterium]|nr:GTPase [Planctomycetota bacterium]